MKDSYGLTVMFIFIIAVLIIVKVFKPKPPRNRFILDLETWVKGHKDKRISNHLEVHIERHFPEFKAWKDGPKKDG